MGSTDKYLKQRALSRALCFLLSASAAGVQQGLWNGWIIPAHIERARSYGIAYFRNWNNAGPDVVFGFEGAPGYQVSRECGFGRSSFGDGFIPIPFSSLS